MVDTGATRSVVSAKLLEGRSTFIVRPATTNWRGPDSAPLLVVGESNLSVRYGGSIVDLDKVVVMENSAFPIIQGVDWISKSGATIFYKEGKGHVQMPQQKSEIQEQDGSGATEEEYSTAAAEMRVLGVVMADKEHSEEKFLEALQISPDPGRNNGIY